MDFELSEQEKSFREEVRQFLKRKATPELIEEMRDWQWERTPNGGPGPRVAEFGRELGETGWLGIAWPKEYGGLGRSVTEAFILDEELRYHGLVIPNLFAVTMVGPTILDYGTEEQKKEFLPKIVGGEIEIALGYTEPQAGTDLASLELRAVKDGDNYVLNGQKMFSTAAHHAKFHWVAARTNTSVPKHQGISMFIVDLKSPDITIRPIETLGGGRTNEVFYDNVRVHKRNLVGEENKGWYYLVRGLEYERLMCFSTANLQRVFEDLIQHVKGNSRQVKPFDKGAFIRNNLAQMAVRLEIGRLLCYRTVWLAEKQGITNESAIMKIVVTELGLSLANLGMQVLGLYGQLQRNSRWSVLKGEIEEGYRATVMHPFGAGANEILRDIIATRALGLPRGP